MRLPDWIPPQTRCVLRDERLHWSATDLEHHVDALTEILASACTNCAPIGLLADNSPHWIAVDLAAQLTGATLIPLPDFFSDAQLRHAIAAIGMGSIVCADGSRAASLGFTRRVSATAALGLFVRDGAASACIEAGRLEGGQKITFTSGTTGAPKGIRLSTADQLHTARGLAKVLSPLGIESHLCLLPLSILLENVAGIYSALLLGASCACPALAEVGLSGACRFDADRCLAAIERYRPHSIIVLPQMLSALVERLSAMGGSASPIRGLKFVAVGGAKTSPSLIAKARSLGLPVYEGYGLSESASVVSLNHPGADRIGTVGRALPGTAVRIAADGEIEVAGRSFAYLGGERTDADTWMKTGDRGTVDDGGYLSIVGRSKDVLVTSFGRNIAPEWLEARLLEHAAVTQAVVVGDARPHVVAVLVARSPDVSDATLEAAVDCVNRDLPEYARIKGWLRAAQAFTASNGLATANGRIRRAAVYECYAEPLNRLYVADDQAA